MDCVPAASGTLWAVTGSSTGATCTALDPDSQLSQTVQAANCEEILPYCEDKSVSKVFEPLEGSKHATLSSASFFTDVSNQYQAIVVGTAAGSANNLVYLAHADANRRELAETIDEEAVDVAAARVGGSANLICFANANAPVSLATQLQPTVAPAAFATRLPHACSRSARRIAAFVLESTLI